MNFLVSLAQESSSGIQPDAADANKLLLWGVVILGGVVATMASAWVVREVKHSNDKTQTRDKADAAREELRKEYTNKVATSYETCESKLIDIEKEFRDDLEKQLNQFSANRKADQLLIDKLERDFKDELRSLNADYSSREKDIIELCTRINVNLETGLKNVEASNEIHRQVKETLDRLRTGNA